MAEFNFKQEEFIKNYNKVKSSRKMAKLYNCSKNTILKYAKQIGYINNYSKKLKPEEKQFVISNYEKMTSGKLAENFNVSRSLILKIWDEAGLKGKISYRYPFYIDYFEEINSKDKAYFLGLIAADGNVTLKDKGKCQNILRIGLLKEDSSILEVMKTYVCSKKPLSIQTKQNNNYISYITTLELVSDKLVEDLEKVNITSKKTYNYIIPNIAKDLESHFIRGYFDGDGSISLLNNQWHTPSAYTCSISGFYKNLQKIQQILKNNNITTFFVKDLRTKDNVINDNFGQLVCKDIENNYKFIKYLYQDCDDLYLHRKKYRADCFLNAISKNFANKNNFYNKIIENAVLNEDRDVVKNN